MKTREVSCSNLCGGLCPLRLKVRFRVWNKFPGIEFCAAVIDSSGAPQMEETDRQYYSRRGNEERKRSRTAATSDSRSIHGALADLCHERAHGSANVNDKTGIRSPAQESEG